MGQIKPTNDSLRLLLVEDDRHIADFVIQGLAGSNFSVEHAIDRATAELLLAKKSYDAVVLDVGLGTENGLEIAAGLRASRNDLPILIVTARSALSDRLTGFQVGADDYLCKPFELAELAARLLAVIRRAQAGRRSVLEFADLQLDLVNRSVQRGNLSFTLSTRETQVLAYFLRHPGQTISREQLLAAVWGDEAEDDSNVVNVYVNYLRNKIEDKIRPRLLHTIRGTGYLLSEKEPDSTVG
jgi:DNA-binding response OmpR family regulator